MRPNKNVWDHEWLLAMLFRRSVFKFGKHWIGRRAPPTISFIIHK